MNNTGCTLVVFLSRSIHTMGRSVGKCTVWLRWNNHCLGRDPFENWNLHRPVLPGCLQIESTHPMNRLQKNPRHWTIYKRIWFGCNQCIPSVLKSRNYLLSVKSWIRTEWHICPDSCRRSCLLLAPFDEGVAQLQPVREIIRNDLMMAFRWWCGDGAQ